MRSGAIDPISVAVTRGGIVEARHVVHGVVVREGRVVTAFGDPELVCFWRSSAKPVQALPLAEVAPDLPEAELAIACASHEALPEQLAAVRALLSRAEAVEGDLECGPEHGSRLGHNCSGKHAGMLLACRRRGYPTRGYRLSTHPLQLELRAAVAQATGLQESAVRIAVDGCGVPTFALPLWRMAHAFTILQLGSGRRVLDAMRAFPELVGGPESVDTLLMRSLPGAVAKRGAEGLLCGVLEDGDGFALKVIDGAWRPLPPAAAALLGTGRPTVEHLVNSLGEQIGELAVERL